MSDFELHATLARDTAFVADWELSRVLLMNDARFPWLILVPRVTGASEIYDLSQEKRALLMSEIAQAAERLKGWGKADKINFGALGNIVPQLHVHVVARTHGDTAWPGPVWGSGAPEPYQDLNAAAAALREAF